MSLFVDSLCNEMQLRSRNATPLHTVYFGGGTPSRLPVAALDRIVSSIHKCFDLELEETTIEANPEDLTRDYCMSLRNLGFFNRVSVGVQSFCDADLRAINRVHNSSQALDAIRNLANAGFNNVSVDFMMGLPGQTLSGWESNLEKTGRLVQEGLVKHLSCYELTVEPGSILHRQIVLGRVTLPDEDFVATEYDLLQQWCQSSGMRQYEVSNYAIPGWHSRHNSRYWNRTPYIGLGPGAHSFDGVRRRWNLNDLDAYIASDGDAPFEAETLTEKDAFNEYVMTALRTADGIDKATLRTHFLWAADDVAVAMRDFICRGLIVETDAAFVPTGKGMLQADALATTLFSL